MLNGLVGIGSDLAVGCASTLLSSQKGDLIRQLDERALR
jgi:hypothetical protein